MLRFVKSLSMLVLAALFVTAALPISAQSNPAALQGGWPLVVGGGFSIFNMDFPEQPGTTSYMEGGTAWADWTRIPFVPRKLGVEAEFRQLSINAPSNISNLRSKTFMGGPTYTWPLSRFSVYVKGLAGYGSMDLPYVDYTHDSRVIFALGGGAQYPLWNGIVARGDYEYQWWPSFLGQKSVDPNGFTLSLAYDFRGSHRGY
jgi:opacity protein-like surface antigen